MAKDLTRELDDRKRQEARLAMGEFEKILEIMPDDRGSLEAAIHAAEIAGDQEHEWTHRMSLAQLLILHGDDTGARAHLEVLREANNARVAEWLSVYDTAAPMVETMSATAEPAESLQPAIREPIHEDGPIDISEEIDLAWHLLEQKQITEEDYKSLVEDLTEMSTSQTGGIVSVLHALESRQDKALDSLLMFCAAQARTPYVNLSDFAMRAELVPLLPEAFIQRRGAMVFDVLGRELLVAVLNPFNTGLREEIERRTGFPCHYFLTRASEFDLAASRLKTIATEE
jgi:hypothetical protein